MTFILVFNFKRVCLFSVTVWDPVRDLVRGIGDLHFSSKMAFSRGLLIFGSRLGPRYGVG